MSYAYRQAGKDWRGRNTGLWTFHADYMREENQGESEEFLQGGDWKKGFQEHEDGEEMDDTGVCYRDTSLIRHSTPLGPYSRNMPRALWWS